METVSLKPFQKLGQNKIHIFCAFCGKEFIKYKSQIKTSFSTCGYSCSNKLSKKNPYIRTEEHREKMRKIISALPLLPQRKAMFLFNIAKSGKTYAEFYGIQKAIQIKEKLQKAFSSEKNPNYIDGRSFFPYPPAFNKLLKEQIKKFDKQKCAKCGITDEECRRKDSLGRGLTIHHMDYDKNNCLITNLVATCKSCNSWANFHKTEAIMLFTQEVSKREAYV